MMSNNHQNISLIRAGASYKNSTAESKIKMVVNMARATFMRAALRCPKDTLSTYFSQ